MNLNVKIFYSRIKSLIMRLCIDALIENLIIKKKLFFTDDIFALAQAINQR